MMQNTIHTLTKFALAFALAAMLVGIGAGRSSAQTRLPQSATRRAAAESNPQVISFTDLGIPEQSVEGAFGAVRLPFGLPASWKLEAGAALQLHFRTFTAEPGDESADTAINTSAGLLKLSFNDRRLLSIPLRPNEERTVTIPITTTALLSKSDDGQYFLHIQFDNRVNCGLNNSSTVVTVLTDSHFTLPMTVASVPTDLSLLPRPIFQQSFLGERAIIVVPSKPTASELQAALLVAAGFGRMTSDRLALSLLPIDQISATTADDAHLIFVGKSAAFPVLQTMALRLKPDAAGFTLPNANTGVIELAPSPLTTTNVALVVSGNTDEGVVKAAKALASGNLGIRTEKSLALITQMPTDEVPPSKNLIDQSFADLGYADWRTERVGRSDTSYTFDLPLDTVADAEPVLTLSFNHAKLPNYAESGMTVSVNNGVVANVRFSEQTTNPTSSQIFIPRASLRAGRNTITMSATLKAQNECMNDTTALWLNIGSNSKLHIPLRAALPQTVGTLDLGAYPNPFDNSLTLRSTVFVLAQADPTNWRAAVRMAANLGSKINSGAVDLAVAYGDAIPAELRDSRNLLIVGQPTQLPILTDLQAILPAPFKAGSDEALDRTTNASYRPGEKVGYLQLLPSPWNDQRVVLTVLGNTHEGVDWASTALLTPTLLQSLSGNFAIVITDQVFLGGTRLSSPVTQPTAASVAPAEPPLAIYTDLATNRTTKAIARKQDSPLLPIMLSFLAMAIVLGVVLGLSWWRRQQTQSTP